MSERYWITGVQLGLLLANTKDEAYRSAENLVDTIIDKQFIGHSPQQDKELSKTNRGAEDTNLNEQQIKSELMKGVKEDGSAE